MENIPVIISLITGFLSVILAGFAFWLSKSAERESRDNFNKTRDLLAEIDKRAAVTERTVTESHQQLLNTVTNLLNQTAVPAKADLGDQFGAAFIQTMLQKPEQAGKMIEALQPLIELSEKQKRQSRSNA